MATRYLQQVYSALLSNPLDLAVLKKSLEELLEYLAGVGRSYANCWAVDLFSANSEEWERDLTDQALPDDFHDVLAMMGEALHDTVADPMSLPTSTALLNSFSNVYGGLVPRNPNFVVAGARLTRNRSNEATWQRLIKKRRRRRPCGGLLGGEIADPDTGCPVVALPATRLRPVRARSMSSALTPSPCGVAIMRFWGGPLLLCAADRLL